MKLIIQAITNSNVSNTQLIQSLRSKIADIEKEVDHNEVSAKVKKTQDRILREAIPKEIAPHIKESDFANNLDYKKELIKECLMKSIEELRESEQVEKKEVEAILSLEKFFKQYNSQDLKDFTHKLDRLNLLEVQYDNLKSSISNDVLLQQVHAKLQEVKSQVRDTLKNLTTRKQAIIINITDIKKCIPKIRDRSIFAYWLVNVFEGLVYYEASADDKSLVYHSLKMFNTDDQKVSEKNIYRLDIAKYSYSFRKNHDQSQTSQFLDTLEKTFLTVKQIQDEIIQKILESYKSSKQRGQISEQEYEIMTRELAEQRSRYQKKVMEEIFPTLYLFGTQNRNRLLKIINNKNDIDSMPSLLLSYRYSVESRDTDNKYPDIAKKIAQKLKSGGDTEFKQVCFFLEINSKMIKIDGKKKIFTGVDLSISLVKILIDQTIDSIQYSKIQKLLRLQENIREFQKSQSN